MSTAADAFTASASTASTAIYAVKSRKQVVGPCCRTTGRKEIQPYKRRAVQ